MFWFDIYLDLLFKVKNICNFECDKCKYGFKDNRIEYKEGCLMFELKFVD